MAVTTGPVAVYCTFSTLTGKGNPIVRQPETPSLAGGPAVRNRTAFNTRNNAMQTEKVIVNVFLIRSMSPNGQSSGTRDQMT